MICLCLTAATTAENRRLAAANAHYCRLFELRVDRLRPEERPMAAALSQEIAALHNWRGILTIRLPSDGGSWTATEAERLALMRDLLASGGSKVWAYVDLEANLALADVESLARSLGVGIIRSTHDFAGVSGTGAELAATIGGLARDPEVVRKYAGFCRGSADLATILEAAALLRAAQLPFVALGMGEYGQPTRVLAPKIGSRWTYASPSPDQTVAEPAAPGQVDPATLANLYHYDQIGPKTAIFGVIGNPIAHSRSPEFHNARFRAAEVDACYIRALVDDVAAFRRCADLLAIQGLSVTIPHKEAVQAWAETLDPAVQLIGAANTLVQSADGWQALNTDAAGFYDPLAEAFREAGQSTAGGVAMVIGAGGAARAVIYSLLANGFQVLIANRTLPRAAELAESFASLGGVVQTCNLSAAPAAFAALTKSARGPVLIAQTTSLGMAHGSTEGDDALPNYYFTGQEWVYDIVYTPPMTPFLKRAQQAGCRILNGGGMFEAQAAAQSKLFLARLVSLD